MTREWDERMSGKRPVLQEDLEGEIAPVSCLTAKYGKSEWVADFYNNESIFTLPGQGDQTNDKCGTWVHALSCPNHGKSSSQLTLAMDKSKEHDRFVVQHTCGRGGCPVCYESWASRESTRAADRLIQCLDLYRKAGYKIEYQTKTGIRQSLIGKIDHIVVSPPQYLAKELIRTKGGYRTLKTMAIELLKKHGVYGAAIVFHPFRQNDGEDAPFIDDIPKYAWYVSPHFHVVGSAFLTQSDKFFEATGWIYKKEPRRESIKGTIKYVLSHCGICEGFQAITYFGLFSNNKIVIDRIEKTTESINCKCCGEELHEYSIVYDENGNMDWDKSEDLGVYLHAVVHRFYKIRDPVKRKICIAQGENDSGIHSKEFQTRLQ